MLNKALMSGNVPGWVLKAYQGVGVPSAALHYDEDRYWVAGYGRGPWEAFHSITRASVKYVQNSAGIYLPIASGAKPLGIGTGILPEQAATNICLQSQNFGTTWTISGSHGTLGALTNAPDNTNTGQFFAEDNANNTHQIVQAITIANTTAYTFSGFVKPGTRSWVYFDLFDGSADHAAYFNLSGAGSIGTTVNSTPIITAVGTTGWYRVSVSFTSTATAGQAVFGLATGDGVRSYTGTTGLGLSIWQAQLETGSFPTSPVLTTSGSATRAFDNISPSGAALNALKASSGTVIVSLGGGIASLTGTILGINSLIGLGKTSGNALTTAFGGSQTSGNTATWTGNVKAGLRWTPSTVGLVLNGGTIVSAANTPPDVTSAFIGSTSGSSAAVNQFIKRLSVIPSAVSDAQFQSLTQ